MKQKKLDKTNGTGYYFQTKNGQNEKHRLLIFRELFALPFYQGIWMNILLDSIVWIFLGEKKDFLKIINLYIAKKKKVFWQMNIFR